jgi:hypothetical protein
LAFKVRMRFDASWEDLANPIFLATLRTNLA